MTTQQHTPGLPEELWADGPPEWDLFMSEVEWRLKSVGMEFDRAHTEALITTSGLAKSAYEIARETPADYKRKVEELRATATELNELLPVLIGAANAISKRAATDEDAKRIEADSLKAAVLTARLRTALDNLGAS